MDVTVRSWSGRAGLAALAVALGLVVGVALGVIFGRLVWHESLSYSLIKGGTLGMLAFGPMWYSILGSLVRRRRPPGEAAAARPTSS